MGRGRVPGLWRGGAVCRSSSIGRHSTGRTDKWIVLWGLERGGANFVGIYTDFFAGGGGREKGAIGRGAGGAIAGWNEGRAKRLGCGTRLGRDLAGWRRTKGWKMRAKWRVFARFWHDFEWFWRAGLEGGIGLQAPGSGPRSPKARDRRHPPCAASGGGIDATGRVAGN